MRGWWDCRINILQNTQQQKTIFQPTHLVTAWQFNCNTLIKSPNYRFSNTDGVFKVTRSSTSIYWLPLCDSVMIRSLTMRTVLTSPSPDKMREPLISSCFKQWPSLLLFLHPPSHAVTLPVCTCQISLTSSAATPYDTPPYCPEPACHLTLYAFMRLCVKKESRGKEATRGKSNAKK